MGNEVSLKRKGQEEQVYGTGKVFTQQLKSGDVWTLKSGGGGGFGQPLERDLDRVERDVVNGYVSAQAARSQYGVVIDAKSGRADRVATAELREHMRANGLPVDQPLTSPARLMQILSDDSKRGAYRVALGEAARAARADGEWRAEAAEEGIVMTRCCS
jgi:hypothetical protein